MPLIAVQGLTKIYRRGLEEIHALDDVSLEIGEGEFVAIVGPSGSGKSTLLNLLGCMDSPTTGTIELNGERIESASERVRTNVRRKYIGFVFQHFGLVPTLTVEENIKLPHLFARSLEHEGIGTLLENVSLTHRRKHLPHELSGGEMQRVAIARALFNKPKLLLADEPTGNLDSVTGEVILELFRNLNRKGLTVIVVTHNEKLAAAAQRQISIRDGRLSNPR